METKTTYDFGAGSARLTCLFEDAAEVAVSGQATGLSLDRYAELVSELEHLTSQVDAALADLKRALS